jgi:hypothetical protein
MYRVFCATLQRRRTCYVSNLPEIERVSLPTAPLVLSDYKRVFLRMGVNEGLSLCPRVLQTKLQPRKISDPSPGGGEDMVVQ